MKNFFLTFFSIMLWSLIIPSKALALVISTAEVTAEIDGVNLGIIDIKPKIKDGQRLDFDLHDFFPTIFGVGRATGFVFADEGPNFGILEKGLRLENTVLAFPAGSQIDVRLFVQATWLNPGGLTNQFLSINGILQSNTAFSRTDVTAFQNIDPFIGPMPTQDNLSPIIPGLQQKNVTNSKGPLAMVRPPEPDVFTDSIELGSRLPAFAVLGDFSIADFTHTTLERVSVSEPNPLILLALPAIGLIFCRRKANRNYTSSLRAGRIGI
jgi:hypothetical protein